MSSSRAVDNVPVVELDFDTNFDLEFPSIQDFLSSNENKSLDDASASLNKLALSDKKGKKESKSGSNSPDLADPVVISTSITTQHNKDLHELLQSPQYHAYNLTAVFDFEAAETDHGLKGFMVRMRLESKTAGVIKELSPERCFPSKKLAKEVAAGLALQYLKELPAEIAKLPRAESDVGSTRSDDPVESVNWVGMLQDFCQPRGSLPKYVYLAPPSNVQQQFSCQVTEIPSIPNKVFGDKTTYYRTKKIAKAQAAKAAMLYIQDNPPPPVSSSGKKKASPIGGGKAGKFVGKTTVALPGSTIKIPDRGVVEKVTLICPQLGLSLPEYDFQQDPMAPALFDVTAIVRRGFGKKDVRIGPLQGIFGKKNAKESMATSILRWLHKEAEKNQITIEYEKS